MNPEERQMLEESLKLARENNGMLNKIIWQQRKAALWRWAYWIIIVVITIASYYAIQPYLNSLIGVYSGKDIQTILGNMPSNNK